MKFTPEVIAALETLKSAAENDFERHRINILEKDLTSPPTPEVIDGNHQKFDGVVYSLSPKAHFCTSSFLHRAVYSYYCGEIPEGYVIHHIDRNKSNNNIENLQCVTIQEHSDIHSQERVQSRQPQTYVCAECGKTYYAYETGNNKFCSVACRRKARQTSEENLKSVICIICGKNFFTRKDKSTKTCSPQCASKLAQQTLKSKVIETETKICAECGKEFQADKSRPSIKFCSSNCQKNHNRKKENEIRTCVICGNKFSTRKYRNAKTCSAGCQGKFRSINHQENKVDKYPGSNSSTQSISTAAGGGVM